MRSYQIGLLAVYLVKDMIVIIMIGGITPIFGSMLFTPCAITGATVGQFVKEIWPFILALLIVLVTVPYMPSVVMFFPKFL